jgi:hypothetical protein
VGLSKFAQTLATSGAAGGASGTRSPCYAAVWRSVAPAGCLWEGKATSGVWGQVPCYTASVASVASVGREGNVCDCQCLWPPRSPATLRLASARLRRLGREGKGRQRLRCVCGQVFNFEHVNKSSQRLAAPVGVGVQVANFRHVNKLSQRLAAPVGVGACAAAGPLLRCVWRRLGREGKGRQRLRCVWRLLGCAGWGCQRLWVWVPVARSPATPRQRLWRQPSGRQPSGPD